MSDLAKNPVVIGAGCGLGGLFIGAMLATATLNSKVEDGVKRSVSSVTEAVQGDGDAVAALSEQIAALQASVAENSESVAALGAQVSSDVGARVDALGAQVTEMSESLGSQIAETSQVVSQTASEQAAQLESALADLPAKAEDAAEAAASSAEAAVEEAEAAVEEAAASTEAAVEDTADAAADAVGLDSAGDALGVGETESLADGAVRAFVQQFDAEAGTAVLSVNRESATLAVGESVVARHDGGACRVGVGAVSDAGVEVSSDCDAEPGSAALGDSYGVGSTALLADGALRVFVSGIMGGDVRLAVNGLATEVVSVGGTVEVETADATCGVTVTGIRDANVSMTGSCG